MGQLGCKGITRGQPGRRGRSRELWETHLIHIYIYIYTYFASAEGKIMKRPWLHVESFILGSGNGTSHFCGSSDPACLSPEANSPSKRADIDGDFEQSDKADMSHGLNS